MKTPGLVAGGIAATMSFAAAPMASAQERSLDEVKAEFMRRAGRLNPFEDISREDAEQVIDALTSLDKRSLGRGVVQGRSRLRGEGDARAKAGASGKELAELYMHALRVCQIGRYPVAELAGQEGGVSGIRCACSARRRSISIRRLRSSRCRSRARRSSAICKFPPGVGKPPVVMHWGGVDGWKEDRLRIAKLLHRAGHRLPDGRHAGHAARTRCPTAIPPAERTYSAWIDHLAPTRRRRRRPHRVWGGSFGAYWAARLAFMEAKRIKGAVFHGGNVHYGFQENGWCRPSPPAARPICSAPASLLEARGQAMGTKTMEEFLKAAPRLSLKDHGPARQAVGAAPRRQRQARRPGAGRGHLSPDGARQSEVGAHLSARPSHGPHSRDARGRDPQHDRGVAEREARELESRPLAPLRFLPIVRAARYR